MESTDSSGGPPSQPNLPPGFRFHPTDEELVVHYLKRKAASVPLPVSIIADIDLYKFDPWELPAKASFGEQEWYFFSPRDRKYPNGARPNRAATSGYWKATGTDKPVIASSSSSSSGGNQKVGVKKALVFYSGKPPKGVKSDWIMHEYRLADNKPSHRCDFVNKKNSLRLDDWVLCRIYKKNNSSARLHTDKDLMMIDDDIFRQIPPSISGFQQHNFSKLNFFPARFSGGYGVFSDNNDPAAIYDGGGTNYSGMNLASSSASTAEQLMMANLKRDIPAPYWPVVGDQEDQNSPEKRFNGGGGGGGDGGGGGECSNITSSMASPLGGILGEGLMRTTTYQSSGLNWYT